MKRLLLCLTSLVLTISAGAQNSGAVEKGATVFAYFKEPGTQGAYFALSRDGYTFTSLNDGQPRIKPDTPGEITRTDPGP